MNFSLYAGYPVISAYDSVDSERQFFGASVHFTVLENTQADLYLVDQQVSGLTDRQAVGAEVQHRHDRGFLFAIFDYDVFYEDINHVNAIGNYRMDDAWTLNVSYDFRKSPLLSTVNALQGQTVTDLEQLKSLFSDDEIYQLAIDRTSDSHHLLVSSSHQLDQRRSLFLTLSLTTYDATPSSGGVNDTPAIDDVHMAADYTVQGFFSGDDFTTLGLRLADTSSASILSMSARSRFSGGKGLRYDPRVRLEYREGKTTGVNQWTIYPRFRLTYRASERIEFEGGIGAEYTTFDLAEVADQTLYDVFLGYIYRF